MSVTLYQHQEDLLADVSAHPTRLVLAKAGTGKTLPLLMHMTNLMAAGEVSSCLVVAPLSGLAAWKRDIEKLPQWRQDLARRIALVNYDKASRKSAKRDALFTGHDLVVLDEGHTVGYRTSGRTKYLIGTPKRHGVVMSARYRYLLTGTLISNSKLERLWTILGFVLGWENWVDWGTFSARYLVTRRLPNTAVDIVVGYRNSAELIGLVEANSFAVEKEVCLDLPAPLEDEVLFVPWHDAKSSVGRTSRQLYEEAGECYIQSVDLLIDNPLVAMLRLRQIAAGHLPTGDGQSSPLPTHKIEFALDLIEDTLPDKVVVFYHFSATCDRLSEALRERGIEHMVLNGATKDKSIWRKFQEPGGPPVIIVQYQTGGMSIDLYAANVTIYMEPTDSSILLEQSRARTHRQGQTRPCSYIFLLTEDSIEIDMYHALQKHQDFTESLYRTLVKGGSVYGVRPR